ncbi:MAG: SoxR reducing system RseC family protein [Bacteroidales bacterium]|nr:SoxR reducing system RseC family protein [Bacteroidales bacterium]
MAAEEIAHAGRIVEITPEFTTVEILSESACGSCHAAGLCGLSEVKRKAVLVPTRGIDRKVGDEVNVCLRASMGLKAVAIAYVGPLAVLLAVVLALQGAGVGDLLSGLAGIGAAGLYYLLVYLLRDRLGKEYSFYIKE